MIVIDSNTPNNSSTIYGLVNYASLNNFQTIRNIVIEYEDLQIWKK